MATKHPRRRLRLVGPRLQGELERRRQRRRMRGGWWGRCQQPLAKISPLQLREPARHWREVIKDDSCNYVGILYTVYMYILRMREL